MKKLFIKPARPDLVVRNFERRHLPIINPEGEWVSDLPQWRRYLKAGDVVLATPKKATKTSEKGDK